MPEALGHQVISRPYGDGCLAQLHSNEIGSIEDNGATCSGQDNYYDGHLADDHATGDGYCAKAVLDGVLMASSCNSSGINFLFLDPQSNSSANTCVQRTNWTPFCSPNTGF